MSEDALGWDPLKGVKADIEKRVRVAARDEMVKSVPMIEDRVRRAAREEMIKWAIIIAVVRWAVT